jgi:RNA polymerase sigma-70 factor (ECF subfamily)
MKISFRSEKTTEIVDQQQDWDKCLEQIGQERDKSAFAELFVHFSPLLKAFLMSNGGQNIETVEEIVQETMIKVWRKAANYSASQGAASTWIYTIARNTRIDVIRSQSRRNPDQLHADDVYNDNYESLDAQSPQSSLVRLRDKKQIKEKLGELPQDQAEVLTLMYFEGKSGQQVADMLDLPLGTVKSRIRLALAKMKLSLKALQAESAQLEGATK